MAVLQYLGGVLPPHMGYNPDRKQVTHDWLWSVGAHPMSVTSTGERGWTCVTVCLSFHQRGHTSVFDYSLQATTLSSPLCHLGQSIT